MALNQYPYFSNVREGLFFVLGTWEWITQVVQSPVFRTSSLLPIVGYMIIYGEAFQGWFEFKGLGEMLLLSASDRLRCLYWGGICMLISTSLHWGFCPRLIKRFPARSACVDNFVIAKRSQPVLQAVIDLAQLTGEHNSRKAQFSNLMNHILRILNPKDPEFMKLIAQGVPKLSEFERNRFLIQFGGLLTNADTDKSDRLTEPCIELISFSHTIQNGSRPILRITTIVFAIVGIALVVFPALDTFVRVVLIELG